MKINMRYIFLLALTFLLLIQFSHPVELHSDRGGIPNQPTDIYEPAQLAIISWDNGYEVLYISSVLEVYSDTPISIIEVLPLPSIPKIELGDKKIFEQLGDVLMSPELGSGRGGGSLGPPTSGGEVLFNKVLGPHNVTVIFANSSSFFISVIRDIFMQNNLDAHEMKVKSGIVDAYILRGYKYFAIDLVTISPYSGRVMVEPIIYKFKSSKVYYPMLISKFNTGPFTAKLFFITTVPVPQDILDSLSGVSLKYYYSKPYFRWELSSVDSRLVEPFPFWKTYMHLTYFEIEGYYELLSNEDILFELKDYYSPVPFLLSSIIISLYIYPLIRYPQINKKSIMENLRPILLYSMLTLIPLIIYLIGIPYVFINRLLPNMNNVLKWMTEARRSAIMFHVNLLVQLMIIYFQILSISGLMFYLVKVYSIVGKSIKLSFWKNPIIISLIMSSSYTLLILMSLTYLYQLINPYSRTEIVYGAAFSITSFALLLIIIIIVINFITKRLSMQSTSYPWEKPELLAIGILMLYLFAFITYLAFIIFTMEFYYFIWFTFLCFFIELLVLAVLTLGITFLGYFSLKIET